MEKDISYGEYLALKKALSAILLEKNPVMTEFTCCHRLWATSDAQLTIARMEKKYPFWANPPIT
jgi:hypothetical protein